MNPPRSRFRRVAKWVGLVLGTFMVGEWLPLVMEVSSACKRRVLDWMHPELRHISSHGEKKQVVRDAYKERWRRHPWTVVGSGLLVVAATPIVAIAFLSLPGLLESSQWVRFVVSTPIGLLGCWALARCNRRTARQFFVEELAKRGIPLCRSCAHDLTGNVSGTCPECGAKVPTP